MTALICDVYCADVIIAPVGANDGMRFFRSAQGMTLGVLSVTLLFAWLGSGSIDNGDDAVYAWAGRRMVEESAWLTYRWHGADLYAAYPPLHFILLRTSLTIFGQGELAYRLPAAMAALVSVLITGDIACRLSRSRSAGLLAGLCLLSSATFYIASRSVRLDMTFLAFAMGTYASYLRAQTDSRYFWLLGVAAGSAYLAKSLLVAFVLLPITLDVLLFRRELLRERRVYEGAFVFVALASLWHVSLWAHGLSLIPPYGDRILKGIAGNFSFETMLRAFAEGEDGAGVLWVAGIAFLAWAARQQPQARVFVLAVPCGLIILYATRTSMPHYALSLLPPLAIGAGWALSKLVDLRPVTAPLAVSALLLLFASNNLSLWVHPDLSPGAREAAALAREMSPRKPVLFFRDYSAAFDFYLNRRTLLITESERAYELYVAHPAMREGPGIALMTPQRVFAALLEPHAMVATTLPFDPALQDYLTKLPAHVQAAFERKQIGAYVLYRPRSHSALSHGNPVGRAFSSAATE